MAAKVILSAKQNSLKFSDRVLNLDNTVTIGRSGAKTSSASNNAFFDSKVLSKSHAMLLCEDSKVYILDTGSSNGTFVNNIRLTKAGRKSDPVEVFTGDIIKFGSEVEDKNKKVLQKPVVAKITIFMEDRVETRERTPTSLLFRPAESQEDVTMVVDDEQGVLSRESMVLLKEKLLEMQKGMEFLTYKERDYEELQQLAEEEAETICELEKENYKLKLALNNIENKIAHEKDKYMKLAQYEAETICSLEKENYKLIESLNTAEESLKMERKKNKILQEASESERNALEAKLHEAFEAIDLENNTLDEANNVLNGTRNNVINLEDGQIDIKSQDQDLLEATEADYDLLVKAELNTLTESRRHSQENNDEGEAYEGRDDVEHAEGTKNTEGYKISTTRQDCTLMMIVAWVAFMIGYLMEDFSFFQISM